MLILLLSSFFIRDLYFVTENFLVLTFIIDLLKSCNCNFLYSFYDFMLKDIKIIKKTDNSVFIFDLLKLCNNLKIFYLNKSRYNNFDLTTYDFGKGTNNFIKFFIPYSLTSSDLDYFLQVLNQFNYSLNNIKDGMFQNDLISLNIDIPLLAMNLNIQDSGKFRLNFINFLDKMSHITITYEKKITHNNFVIKGSGNLMCYKVLLNNSLHSNNKNTYKKIEISINRYFYFILKKANYNYKVINFNHMKLFPSSQLRLIYYYICLKIIPGTKYYTEISFNNFLNDLWLPTLNDSTQRTRKQRLIVLLHDFSKYVDSNMDLVFYKYKNSIILSDYDYFYVKVKRSKRLVIKQPF